MSVALIGVIIAFFVILIAQAGKRWNGRIADEATQEKGELP
jgi:hypothetical protein